MSSLPTPGRALVVGNSDGIGLALTQRLLADGWRVFGVSRRPSPIVHDACEHLVADVGAPDFAAVLEAGLRQRPAFELCVFCAGIGELFDPSALAAEAQVFRVNLVGAVETAAVVLPRILAASKGHFIGLSSIGDGISPEAPSYSASKAGLSAYLGGLSLARRERGVHVTNVRFGFVDTRMAKARSKPFMLSPQQAAEVIIGAMATRPARLTYPKVMSALMWILSRVTWLRLWLL